jgi:hypothetical protein
MGLIVRDPDAGWCREHDCTEWRQQDEGAESELVHREFQVLER